MRLQEQAHIPLHTHCCRAGEPKPGIESFFRLLAQFFHVRMGVCPGTVVGIDHQFMLTSGQHPALQIQMPGTAQVVVLTNDLSIQPGAAKVAHPAQIQDDLPPLQIPVCRHLQFGAVPTRGGRIILKFARTVWHPDGLPARFGRRSVRGRSKFPHTVE